MVIASQVHAGMMVLITDYDGHEHLVRADSDVEGVRMNGRKVHDFPVVWVHRPLHAGGTDRVPWPAANVRLPDAPTEDGGHGDHG